MIAIAQRGELQGIVLDRMSDGAMQSVRDWMRGEMIDPLSSHDLRFCKAAWFLRRHKGDSLKVSRALGNTPQITFNHYGGKGNLTVAQIELTHFFKVDPDLKLSIAPGYCADPGHATARVAKPMSCSSEAACLQCTNYRGEDSLDYLHRMLTLQHSYRLRESGASGQHHQSIADIDRIVAAYVKRHPETASKVESLSDAICAGNEWHPRFARVMAILGQSQGIVHA